MFDHLRTYVEVDGKLVVHVAVDDGVDEFVRGRTVGLQTRYGRVERNVLRRDDAVLRPREHGRRLARHGYVHRHAPAQTRLSWRQRRQNTAIRTDE